MVPGFHPPWIGPSMAFFFFLFFLFSPLLFNIVQSERGKGRGLARGHTFLLTQVFFQQAGGPAGDKDGAAPWAVCWLQGSGARGARRGTGTLPSPSAPPRHLPGETTGSSAHPLTLARPKPHSPQPALEERVWDLPLQSLSLLPLWTELSRGSHWQDFAWLHCSPQGWAEDPICKQDLAALGPGSATASTP